MENHVLIIEDDKDIREGIRILLEGEGFTVTEAEDGMEGLQKLSSDISLVILDIMMPGISGLKTCEEIRKTSVVPILFLTAKSRESDKLVGFMAGGDDYLVKPFSYTELFARIKALLRRHQVYDKVSSVTASAQDTWLACHDIRLNTSRNIVYHHGTEIKLTEIEYKLLLLLMSYPTKTFTLQNLYESVWNEPFLNFSSNTIMVHMRNLRKKIEDNPQEPQIIKTVWGKGYRLG